MRGSGAALYGLRRFSADLHVPAQHLGVRIGGLAAVIFIVGQNGKQSGVNARQPPRKVGGLVPPRFTCTRTSLS